MLTEILMPKLGESVIEGTVSKWLVREGEVVHEFDPILEVTTDKVDTEIPASGSGTILKLLVSDGKTVPAGTVLGWIGELSDTLPTEQGFATHPTPATTMAPFAKAVTAEQSNKVNAFVSPVVAKLAAEHNVDLNQITGTGNAGRITKKDVESFIEKVGSIVEAPKDTQHLTPMRQAIAKHMVQSKQTSAHVTTVFEVNMSAVTTHQLANKTRFMDDGIKLTLTSYFVVASANALLKHTIVNSTMRDDKILLMDSVNVGVAVALGEDGLIVPVIKDAAGKLLPEIALDLNGLVTRARNHRLSPDEVQSGTFTITNHGVSGSLMATAIINQPQCAILAVGAVQKRAIVEKDKVVVQPMAYMTLTFDHRIIDGAIADAFMNTVKTSLENWT